MPDLKTLELLSDLNKQNATAAVALGDVLAVLRQITAELRELQHRVNALEKSHV